MIAPFLFLHHMHFFFRLITQCFFVLAFFNASSQPFIDIVNVSVQKSQPTELLSKTKFNFSIASFLAATNIPVNLKNENKLLFGPSYELHNYNFESSSLKVYSVALPVTFLKQWKNKKWKTAFVFISRINKKTDYSATDGALQFGGAVLNTLAVRQNFKLKFGAYYNKEFFGNYIIPLAGIDWNINAKLNLFGVLPNALTLEWKNSKYIHTGISFRGITTSYLMDNDIWLKVEDNYLKALVDFYVAPGHVLFCEAGHSVLRKFTIEESVQKFDLEVNDGWLIRAGYAFRIRLDD